MAEENCAASTLSAGRDGRRDEGGKKQHKWLLLSEKAVWASVLYLSWPVPGVLLRLCFQVPSHFPFQLQIKGSAWPLLNPSFMNFNVSIGHLEMLLKTQILTQQV